METDHNLIFGAARLALSKHWTYYRRAIFGLRPVWSDQVPTMGVSAHGVLYLNRSWVTKRGVPGTVVDLLHEIYHVLRDDHARAETMGLTTPSELKLANICQDAANNHHIREMLVSAIDNANQYTREFLQQIDYNDGRIYPETLGVEPNLPWEAHYKHVAQQAQEASGDDGGSQGEPGEGSNGNGAGEPTEPHPGHGRCGGCAGIKESWEEDLPPAEAKKAAKSMDRLRRAVAHDIKDHAERKGVGTVPGDMLRWANTILKKPPIRWRDTLRYALRRGVAIKCGETNYTFARPHRAQANFGWGHRAPIMPSTYAVEPKIGFAADTSTSMGSEEGAYVMGTLEDVIKQLGVALLYIACDVQASKPQIVRTVGQALKLTAGGGGTAYGPVFEVLEKMPVADRPAVLMFVCDGGNFDELPASPPKGVSVVWVLVGQHRCRPRFAGNPWGMFIDVPSAEEEGRA